MLQFLNRCSKGRGAWLLMALTALVLELVALYFQHVMLLQPCVMCIYERAALFGILGASLLGAVAPKSPCVIWLFLSGFTAPERGSARLDTHNAATASIPVYHLRFLCELPFMVAAR